jgi:hypothetical protein
MQEKLPMVKQSGPSRSHSAIEWRPESTARPAIVHPGERSPSLLTLAGSASAAVLSLLAGPEQEGVGLGLGYVDFGGYVLALTRPGRPRMPNGMECELDVQPGERCCIGRGRLAAHGTEVLPASVWDPVPTVRFLPRLELGERFEPNVERLAGRGDGLTPAGDDLLSGYVAGLTLFHGRIEQAVALAEAAALRTTHLSATLLRHAARGELPEPAHALLERGDAGPLHRFGHSSGRYLLLGLAVAASALPELPDVPAIDGEMAR